MTSRWGLTVPLTGVPLHRHAEIIRALPDLGFTDIWSAEVNGADAFTPLALAAAWEPTLRLGTAIVPAFTRGPALIAMSAAALADAAPGRFVLGLGASSPAIVENWNGIAFEQPFRRTRDVLRAVRSALAGEVVEGRFDTFAVKRFKLEQAPASPPPLALAALRPQMLRLAGREADGAILNWLASTDVARCIQAIGNPATEVIARVFVCPTADAEYARAVGRLLLSTYLTVPAYAAFHDWLGRGERLREMHERWAAGDRRGANAAIPDEVVDELFVHGSPEACREQVAAYVEAGVQTPTMLIVPTADGPADLDLLRRLGPR
ncbi:MAG TPA: LLM class F420-dependent oxidoreductase [Jatrophihabitans sp.]|jgi:probable F420-dependent oxidoreductase|nr:LLM class F420-dependent oxidoreductase [Jatrophihabitans sp.]